MKTTVIVTAACLLLLFSCKKEADVPVDQPDPVSQFSLGANPGSYWIFQIVDIDSSGTETLITSDADTVYRKNDTTINGNLYVQLDGDFFFNNNYHLFMRDSSGFIVNEKGDILFAINGSTDTTVSTFLYYNVFSFTHPSTVTINVPAGNAMEVFDKESHYYRQDGNPVNPCEFFWLKHTYYDANNGIPVLSEFSISSTFEQECKVYERRLLSFQL